MMVRRKSTGTPDNAAKYYVSDTGSDANTGHSPDRPWLTTTKLNTATFVAGDSVFFNKGDTFAGQINVTQAGSVGSPIVLTSYGTGAAPIISGSVTLSTWVQNGAIWACKASADVFNVFVGGVQQTLARVPNVGQWYAADSIFVAGADSLKKIVASELSDVDLASRVGSTLHLRLRHWDYDTRTIASTNTDTIRTTTLLYATPTQYYGFYLNNAKGFIDSTGEWYCNTTTDSVYYQPATGVDPNTLTIVGSTVQYGVSTGQNYVTVRDLKFDKQYGAGIYVSGTPSNVILTGNTITNQLENGIKFADVATASTISNNTISDVNYCGILAQTITGATISGNTISRCGVVPGLYDQSIGIDNFSGTATISGNTIDSTGWSGIYAGGSSTVKNNVISNFLLTANDGGGIYVTANTTKIQTNIVSDGHGYGASSGGSVSTIVGIYLDQATVSSTIEGNTIIRPGTSNSYGIFSSRWSDSDTIRYNTIYDGYGRGIHLKLDSVQTSTYNRLVVKGNTFFSRDTNSYAMSQWDYQDRAGSVGWFKIDYLDYNNYLNPHQDYSLNEYYNLVTYGLDVPLAMWKDSTGKDANAVSLYQTYPDGTTYDSLFVNRTSSPVTYTVTDTIWHNFAGAQLGTSIVVPADSAILAFQTYVAPLVPTVVDTATKAVVAGLTQTVPITVTDSSNAYLVVFISLYPDGDGPFGVTATYNGVAMTWIDTVWVGAPTYQQITALGLKLPNLGTHNVVLTLSEAGSGGIVVANVKNVNQTTPYGDRTKSWAENGTGCTVSSSATELVIDGNACNGAATTTQTLVGYQAGGGDNRVYMSKATGAASTVMDYNVYKVMMAFALKGL